MRASQIAETYINGNRSDARNAVLADPRPDLMALDVLTELLDAAVPKVGDTVNFDDVARRWRNCLAGGI